MDTLALCAEIVRQVEWRARWGETDRRVLAAMEACEFRIAAKRLRSGVRLTKLFGESATAETVEIENA